MKTFKQFMEQSAPDSKFYRNYLNDVLPGSAGPSQQMPIFPDPKIKQDALQYWMKTRGFPGVKAPVKTKKPLVA